MTSIYILYSCFLYYLQYNDVCLTYSPMTLLWHTNVMWFLETTGCQWSCGISDQSFSQNVFVEILNSCLTSVCGICWRQQNNRAVSTFPALSCDGEGGGTPVSTRNELQRLWSSSGFGRLIPREAGERFWGEGCLHVWLNLLPRRSYRTCSDGWWREPHVCICPCDETPTSERSQCAALWGFHDSASQTGRLPAAERRCCSPSRW